MRFDERFGRCEECGGEIVYDGKEYYCKNCGVVVETALYKGKAEEDVKFCKKCYENKNVPSKRHPALEDVFRRGNGLVRRRRKLHPRQIVCLNVIKQLCSYFNAPKTVLQTAKLLLNKKIPFLNGLKAEEKAYVLFCVACYLEKVPFLPTDLRKVGLDKPTCKKVETYAVKILKYLRPFLVRTSYDVGAYYVKTICARLGCPDAIAPSISTYNNIVNVMCSSPSPLILAAISVLVTCKKLQKDVPRKKIAKITGVSPQGLSITLRKLAEHVEFDLFN